MSGYIKLYRGWMDEPLFMTGPFSNSTAYLYLLEACCFRYACPKSYIADERPLGSAVLSLKFLSHRFLWTPTRVSQFLDDLNGQLGMQIIIEDGAAQFVLENVAKYCERPAQNVTIVELPCGQPNPPPERRRITSADRRTVLSRQQCKYCRTKSGPFHVDHRTPFSRGGGNHLSNLECACRRCNLSKGAKTVREWKKP